MKRWEVSYTREERLKVVDIVEAETMEEAIQKSKDGNIDDSDEGIGTEEVLNEYGHTVKEAEE